MQAEVLYLQTPGLPGPVMEEDEDKNRSIFIFIAFILVIFANTRLAMISVAILISFILVILGIFRVRLEMYTSVEPVMREGSILELCSLTGAYEVELY